MKILLGAYACEPNNGSEPEVGWQMVTELAKAMPNDDFHVVTKSNNQQGIEGEGFPLNVTFHYYRPAKWLTFWKKGGRGIRTYYYIWMIGAAFFMRRKKLKFDIVHHITFVNDWLPSFLFLLKDKDNKFIWGPIGSHDPISMKFLSGGKRKLIENIRILLQLIFRNLDPSFYLCKAKADHIIGINENVRLKLGLTDQNKFEAEPAIGMPLAAVESIRKSASNEFSVISVGRLLYIKNFELTMRVFANFLQRCPTANSCKLQIVGDGADKECLMSLAKSLGIEGNVEFTGNVPLETVQSYMSEADVFLFPTLENAGFVILEAMSNSLPVLAMNYGGPQQFIRSAVEAQLVSSDDCYDRIVDNLAEKLECLYKDRAVREHIGELNRQDVLSHYTWQAKAEKVTKLYERLVSEA
ncbi:MAG: glycosyltransferase family 4 protein [Pseudomonadales bacterium]|nr:glycosyltransferase family 4 protein [Pseudomonadales bacterium]